MLLFFVHVNLEINGYDFIISLKLKFKINKNKYISQSKIYFINSNNNSCATYILYKLINFFIHLLCDFPIHVAVKCWSTEVIPKLQYNETKDTQSYRPCKVTV